MLLGAQLHFANVLGSRLTNNVARLLWQCQQKTGRHVQTTAATATGSSSTTDDGGSSSASGRSRVYPDEPRVGVGVVVFRRPITKPEELPEVLLIQRAKEPAKGQWCFPGGSLELGETMAECAAREVFEETGVKIRSNTDMSSEGFSSTLQHPTPFAAVDSISRDGTGRFKFHYVVVEVAAMAAEPDGEPVANDDVNAVQWLDVNKLRGLNNLTRSCARLAEEARHRFDLSS